MDALETFIQEYSEAAAKPADPNDPLDVTQREDAVAMDTAVAKSVGRESGDSPLARAAEKELGRKPDEPEDAAVERNSESNQEEADVEVGTESFGEQASHQQYDESDGEAAAVGSVLEEDSEDADPARAVATDEEESVPEFAVDDDSEPANPEANFDDFGEAAAIQNIFRDDEAVQTNIQMQESSAMLEIIPIGIKDEIGHSLNNSVEHQKEISFSTDERDTPLPDFANLSDTLSSMDETDVSLSNLPFMASFSGRKRDQ
jgi:hypothetical protein